jgi:uncharacterized protein (DUF433 family)
MHYELWALNAGNLLRDYDTEADALTMVRQLLAGGWRADDLGLGLEFDDGEEGDDSRLPPTLYGAALTARVAETRSGIESRSGVIGGSAGIRHTRIPVWILEQARRLGMSEAEILDAFPSLQTEDLPNAWVYVWTHRDEIDREIEEGEAA